MAVKLGLRTTRQSQGVIAIVCPHCTLRILADQYVEHTELTVNRVAGPGGETKRFLRCRVCGQDSDVPPGTQPARVDDPEALYPQAGALQKTHPALLETPAPAPDRTRALNALMHTVKRGLAEEQAMADSEKIGCIPPIFGIVFGVTVMMPFVGDEPTNFQLIIMFLMMIVGAMLAQWPFTRWNRRKRMPIITARQHPFIRRIREKFSVSLDDVIAHGETLGADFAPSVAHLREFHEEYRS